MLSFSVRFWFLAGFLIAGVMVLVWAALSTYELSGTHSLVAYIALFYLVVVVVALAWYRWWSARRSPPIGPLTREEERRRAQREVAFRDARGFLVAGWIVIALVSSVPAWKVVYQGLREEPTARFLDFTAPALTLGWTMVMAALIMLLLVPTPSLAEARRLRVHLSGAVGLAVGAATVALVFVSTTILPVEATTTADPSPKDVAAQPTWVSGVGWRWETPDGAGVVTTVAAGGGLAVLLEDGVVLLDTRTGEERWRYRREDERSGYARASLDGSVLIVTFEARDHTGESRSRLVVFDAHTGRIRSEHQAPGWREGNDYRELPEGVRATATTYIAAGVPGRELKAFRLDSGEAAWRYELPDGCYVPADYRPRPTLEEVVVVMMCSLQGGGTLVYDILVVGLAPDDGEELWRHEEAPPDGAREMTVEASSDGGVYMLRWVTGLEETRLENVFLRTDDGEELARDLEWSDLSLAEESRGGRYRSLTRDGPLMLKYRGVDEEAARYVWFGFGGTERTASVEDPEWFSLEHKLSALPADVLVLQDMVVVAHLQDPDERPPSSVTATVFAEPWEDTEGVKPAHFDVEVRHDGGPLSKNWQSTSLRPTPGAVVLARRGAQEVVGLQ